ncbi:hypothetical protein FSP39_000932 [Pinctada imbricata]|uniref:COMM domain-containing protein 5 n=1 Tax=Pinctada imbricata TaxID=66713 RepID=A0AA89BYH1_PINIB|nr:hypothetical protein FSP39_000932 [Pinctada imbricata]
MSIIQVTGSGGSVPSDRTPFYGGRIPQEIKSLIKPLGKCDKQTFRKLLQWIVAAMEGKDVEYENFKDLAVGDVTEEILTVIYTGLHSLLRSALRLPLTSLKPEMFNEDIKELQIPEQFQEDLASVVFGSRRPHIENHTLESRPRLPRIESLKWRVDVGISTSVLNRVLEPAIMMEITLVMDESRILRIMYVDEEKITYRYTVFEMIKVPVSKFHELRYNVAYVLKEMEDLEKRNILKIQD